MNKTQYQSMLKHIEENKAIFRTLEFLYKWLPRFMFICYPVILLVKFVTDGLHKEFWFLLCVPAGVLAAVTIMRKLINRKRPYEEFGTPSLFERDGEGQSFPSRHTASAFIIAMMGFLLNFWTGLFLIIIAVLISVTRVLSGVHYISDVLAGCILSIVAGTVFLII